MELNFLYWNVNNQDCTDLVAALTREHDVDVIILSECRTSPEMVLLALNSHDRRLYRYHEDRAGIADPLIFTRLPRDMVKPVRAEAGYGFWRLVPAEGHEILLVVAHFFSKQHKGPADYLAKCTDLAHEIFNNEERLGHRRTIIVGDLNMNPFESGMVSGFGLNAVMDKGVAGEITRTVDRKNYRFFYNPMWSHFGDHPAGPSGTYYYNSCEQENYYWNMFDQVLIRPDLIKEFKEDELRILTSAEERSLLSRSGRPDKAAASDHLPIRFRLDLTKGEEHERRTKSVGTSG